MKLISLNIGLPRQVIWRGKTVTTGIFKEPAASPVMLRSLNLDGDGQADLTVHGGVDKAVYVYPSEHYEYWRTELAGADLPWGIFGENFTTRGLIEENVKVGDRFLVGEAEVIVTQPRLPCYKLNVKFKRSDMTKRFLASRRTGFYLTVLRGGMVETGNAVKLISRDEKAISIADFIRVYAFDKDDAETLRQASETKTLPENWKNYFRKQIEKLKGREAGV